MTKVLACVGAILSALVVVGIVAAFYMAHVGQQLDADSKAYVDDVIPRIASNWSPEALIAESSPELMQSTSAAQTRELCAVLLQNLGTLKEYNGSQGESLTEFSAHGKRVTAHYTVHASFEKRTAVLRVGLILKGDQWKLSELNVDSDLQPR